MARIGRRNTRMVNERMRKQFFRLGPILVSQASAMSGGMLVGMPALYAYTGFLKNLCLRLGIANDCDVVPLGLAPVFCSFSLHRGHAKYVRYRRGHISEVDKRGPNHPTIDEPRASFEIYLIIAIGCSSVDFNSSQIEPLLRGMKLAGGGISSASPNRVDIVVKSIDQSDLYLGLPFSSVALADASYILEDARDAGVNGMEAMFQALVAPKRDKVISPDRFQRPSWLQSDDKVGQYFPVCVGARPIENFNNPTQRNGIRQSLKATPENPTCHAFAESVFSIVRGQTVASVRASTRKQQNWEPAIFWREVPPLSHEPQVFGARSIQGHKI